MSRFAPLLLALRLAHADPSEPPTWYGGRVYTAPDVHVGVRPAVLLTNEDNECGVGVTVQVSL